MDINPLKRIYENNQRIEKLKDEIKEIEAESQKCLDYAMVKKIVNVDNFVLRTSVSKRREPISSKVVESLGSEKALEIASFKVGALQKIMGEDDVDKLCKVKETVTRFVEMVNE
ncbi:MAG: hypothetical protein PHS80_00345 [Methanothrix sp.]|nr:hypothetical protein [Bacteroidales bacterium]MDD2753950.1 hypothetical protein [Methanothrix sp.]